MRIEFSDGQLSAYVRDVHVYPEEGNGTRSAQDAVVFVTPGKRLVRIGFDLVGDQEVLEISTSNGHELIPSSLKTSTLVVLGEVTGQDGKRPAKLSDKTGPTAWARSLLE